jgi:hypothetical protein
LLLVASGLYGQSAAVSDLSQQKITLSVDTSVLRALVQFGLSTRLPVGVVLGPDTRKALCEKTVRISVVARPASEFLDDVTAGSGYRWSVRDGVFVFRPSSVPRATDDVLKMKIEHFGGDQMGMHVMGVLLGDRIVQTLHPSNGVGGSILSPGDPELLTLRETEKSSVEQILNRIVSLGSRGMWFFQTDPHFEQYDNVHAYTLSYKDDAGLLDVVCQSIYGGDVMTSARPFREGR